MIFEGFDVPCVDEEDEVALVSNGFFARVPLAEPSFFEAAAKGLYRVPLGGVSTAWPMPLKGFGASFGCFGTFEFSSSSSLMNRP